jgi:S-DNA-T family DNA segregation ATPase FtsK/SpoIIIE
VGRDAGCDVRIDNPRVSGMHLRLACVAGGIELCDLGSTNGTFVGADGRRLAPGSTALLALGERVRLGPEIELSVVSREEELDSFDDEALR